MHRLMMLLANTLAMIGGLILLALVMVTCISVLGRAANTLGHSAFIENNLPLISETLSKLGPILGDFELVEAGVAIAIMAFLPVCQINRQHAIVELFTQKFSPRVSALLDFFWETVFAIVLFVVTWRLFVGTSDKMRYGETTFLLQFPVWWGYAACSVLAVFASIVAIYCVGMRWADVKNPPKPMNVWSSGQ